MKKIVFILSSILSIGSTVHAQSTTATNVYAPGRFIGYTSPFPLEIRTNNIVRALFTTGNSLNSWNGNTGDGLKILAPPNSTGDLSLFTSNSPIFGGNETHAVFGGSGQVSGQNNRFEFISTGAMMGNYYSTFSATGIHRFDRGTTEQGRLGTNNNWRFGRNTSGPVFGGLNAARKVEVVENNVQFRLTYSANAAGPNTDFFSNQQGNLQILPSGQRVGINLNANPTANLDINGNVRIRNVQTGTPNSILVGVNANGASDVNVRRLDFNGNPNTFLSGNGTFQTVNTTPPLADNGVSRRTLFVTNAPYQLGDEYTTPWNFFNTNTPLTVNRQVRLNNKDFIFSGNGKVAIGLTYPNLPTEVLDVNGNTRLRNVPIQGGQSLILGLQNGPNTNDIEFSRLQFTGNTNQVLLGNGTWGSSPNSGVGNYCTDAPHPLTGDYDIPLNEHNFYFSKQGGLNQNQVMIGLVCGSLPPFPSKLMVMQSHPMPITGNTSTSAGTFINSDNSLGGGTVFMGAVGVANGTNNSKGRNIGGFFNGLNATNLNTGVIGNATGGLQTMGGQFTGSNATRINYGVYSMASGNNSITNYGVRTIAFGANNWNYGIYAAVVDTNAYAGYFQGDVYVNGPNSGLGYLLASDAQFKNNIDTISNPLQLVQQLQPKTFYYDTLNAYDIRFSGRRQYGFVAQDVETILPELVSSFTKPAEYDTLGNITTNAVTYKELNYNAFIGILTAAVQKQQKEIDSKDSLVENMSHQISSQDSIITSLNDRLSHLENCLSRILPILCQLNQSAIQQNTEQTQQTIRQQLSVYLSNRETIVLDQNVPNPFAEQTVINFSIPESVKSAQIQFYNSLGSLIKSVEINQRGLGSITVFGSDLSSGTYLYTLIADGVNVVTKKMMKQ